MAADLEIRIGAELTEIKGALAGLQRDLGQVGAAVKSAGAGGGSAFNGVSNSIKGVAGQLKGLIAGFVTLAAVVKTIKAADELNTLQARIKLVTDTQEEYNRATEAVFQLAQRTRTGLVETANTYVQIGQAVKEAGVGQELLLDTVETINKAVQLSGVNANSAQAALIQLTQGLSSGTLRGEELNSVLEQTGKLADVIAKGMRITRGQLRQYGEQGKITSQQIIEALRSQKSEVDKQFAELPLTVGQSITQLENSALRFIGVFDQAAGGTSILARAISAFSELIASPEVLGVVEEFARSWSNAFADIAKDAKDAFDIVVNTIKDAYPLATSAAGDITSFIGQAFKDLPANVRASIRILVVQAASAFDKLVSYARFVKENFAAIFTDDTQDAAYARFQARNQAIAQAAEESIKSALDDRQKALDDAKKYAEEQAKKRAAGAKDTGKRAPGTFVNRPSDKELAAAKALAEAKLDAEEKLAKDSADRQLLIQKNLYDDAQVSLRQYYDARQRIELEQVDRLIKIEERRLQGGNAVDKVKAQTEITLLERRKTDITTAAARERAEAERQIQRQVLDLQIQDLENQGKTAQAATLRLEAQFKDLLKRLKAEGNTAGVELIQRLINTGAAKAQFDELKTQFDRVMGDLERRQQSLQNQVLTGALSPATGQDQQRTARAQSIEQLGELNRQLQELAKNSNDPRIIEGAKQVAQAYQQAAIDAATGWDAAAISLRASLANFQATLEQSVTSAGVDALAQLFTDLASNSKTAGEALRDFVRGFVSSMAQIAARALATYAVLQLLDAVYPGLGKLVSAGASAGVKHSGGMVGNGGNYRTVNPLVFAGAPRYHDGAVVGGLKPDERPAILQTGEEVLSRSDPRNQNNGGGNGVRVINVIDPSLVGDYMGSSAGEKSVLNVLRRNPGAVKQMLA